jgi:hypothetical protein
MPVFTFDGHGDESVARDFLPRRQCFVCGNRWAVVAGSALEDHGRTDLNRFLHRPLDRTDQSGPVTKMRAMRDRAEAHTAPPHHAERDLLTTQLVGQLRHGGQRCCMEVRHTQAFRQYVHRQRRVRTGTLVADRQPALDPDGAPLQLVHGLGQIGLAGGRHFDRSDATEFVADKNWLCNRVGGAGATAAAEHRLGVFGCPAGRFREDGRQRSVFGPLGRRHKLAFSAFPQDQNAEPRMRHQPALQSEPTRQELVRSARPQNPVPCCLVLEDQRGRTVDTPLVPGGILRRQGIGTAMCWTHDTGSWDSARGVRSNLPYSLIARAAHRGDSRC